MLDTIEEVLGAGANGVITKFAQKLAKKTANLLKTNPNYMGDVDYMLESLFKSLKESNWFDDVSIKDLGPEKNIAVNRGFELKAEKDSCDFLASFFTTLFTELYDSNYMCNESHNALKNICMFKMMAMEI